MQFKSNPPCSCPSQRVVVGKLGEAAAVPGPSEGIGKPCPPPCFPQMLMHQSQPSLGLTCSGLQIIKVVGHQYRFLTGLKIQPLQTVSGPTADSHKNQKRNGNIFNKHTILFQDVKDTADRLHLACGPVSFSLQCYLKHAASTGSNPHVLHVEPI